MANGSFAWRKLTEYLEQSRDAFDRDITLGVTNEADLASHYPYSPERYRVFVNGTRQNIQYDGAPPEFADLVDSFSLRPQNSGDVVRFETTERYRYVVQFVIEWSLSVGLNQELQAGDVLVVYYGDPDLENSADDTPGPSADGWFLYRNGGHVTNNDGREATIAEYRDGVAVSEETVTLRKLFQTFGRVAGETNWYNVGPTKFTETSTDNFDGVANSQENETLGRVANNSGKGPQIANKSVGVSIKAGDGAGSLEADVGSIGVRTLGNVDPTVKVKEAQLEADSTVSGEFEPIMALRIKPDKEIVNTQLTVVDPVGFTGGSAGKVAAFSCDPSLTDAANFSTPPEQTEINTSLQQTTDVSTMPDSTGAEVTSTLNPGGYQIGFGSVQSSGSSGKSITSTGRAKKRQLNERDVVVIAAKAPSTGTWTIEYQTEQDW